ncbi:MAG: phage integrase N-terminal SAM-like domain-containing protein, partial [Flavobacteriaceae bacterium]|nr:phage integrase N-terminal SAM-like domain-containing protein [Flavobacteriaceae bacterium]
MNSSSIDNPDIILKKVVHKKAIVLLIKFPYKKEIINKIKSFGCYYWSKSLRGWICPFSDEKLKEVQSLSTLKIRFILDASLKQNLLKKGIKKLRNLTEDNKTIIRNYVRYLKGKRYSESTVRTYFTFVADFIDYIQPKSLTTITNRDVELFLEAVFVPRKYSISTQRQFISALKL